MIEFYSVFCSHHNEAISFYKEQLQNKKLQILIRVSILLSVHEQYMDVICFMTQ